MTTSNKVRLLTCVLAPDQKPDRERRACFRTRIFCNLRSLSTQQQKLQRISKWVSRPLVDWLILAIPEDCKPFSTVQLLPARRARRGDCHPGNVQQVRLGLRINAKVFCHVSSLQLGLCTDLAAVRQAHPALCKASTASSRPVCAAHVKIPGAGV